MRTKLTIAALAASALVAGCGTTEGVIAGIGVVGTALGAISKDADYEHYANLCKEIILAQTGLAEAEAEVLKEAAKTKPSEALLYMALRPTTSGVKQCALAVPQGFFKTLAANGGLLNFFATVYGINRGDAQAQRQMQVNKEMGLAQLDQEVRMESLRNQLITVFGQSARDSFNAGAAAARPIVTPATPAE